MSDDSVSKKVADVIVRQTPRAVKTLIELYFPPSAVFFNLVDAAHEERARIYFEELAKRPLEDKDLTDSIVHAISHTFSASLKTREITKIKWFSRIVIHAIDDSVFADSELPEEYNGILGDMSVSEMKLLQLLEKYETRARNAYEQCSAPNKGPVLGSWKAFMNEASNSLNINCNMVLNRLNRLERTGCVTCGFGQTSERIDDLVARTTPLFQKIKVFADEESFREELRNALG